MWSRYSHSKRYTMVGNKKQKKNEKCTILYKAIFGRYYHKCCIKFSTVREKTCNTTRRLSDLMCQNPADSVVRTNTVFGPKLWNNLYSFIRNSKNLQPLNLDWEINSLLLFLISWLYLNRTIITISTFCYYFYYLCKNNCFMEIKKLLLLLLS